MRARYGEIIELCQWLGDKNQVSKLLFNKEGQKFEYTGDDQLNLFVLNDEIWPKQEKFFTLRNDMQSSYGFPAFIQEIEAKNQLREKNIKLNEEAQIQKDELLRQAEVIIEEARAKHTSGDFTVPRKAKTLQKQAADIVFLDVPEKDTRTLSDHPNWKEYEGEITKLLNKKIHLECDWVIITEDHFADARRKDAIDIWGKFPWLFVPSKKDNVKKKRDALEKN